MDDKRPPHDTHRTKKLKSFLLKLEACFAP